MDTGTRTRGVRGQRCERKAVPPPHGEACAHRDDGVASGDEGLHGAAAGDDALLTRGKVGARDTSLGPQACVGPCAVSASLLFLRDPEVIIRLMDYYK